jgi:trehalose 6-phosphate synthase
LSRLISVSNRVALPKGAIPAGGLAVGLLAAMEECGGVWFGWSGQTVASTEDVQVERIERDGVCYATIPLPANLHEPCYSGFANGSLWPLFHSLLDGFRYEDEEFEAYVSVNEIFARELMPLLLAADDRIWVHDYHLFPLGGCLRRRGATQPLGFFLHIPFPPFEILRALPGFERVLRALLEYDLIGFQRKPTVARFCLQ